MKKIVPVSVLRGEKRIINGFHSKPNHPWIVVFVSMDGSQLDTVGAAGFVCALKKASDAIKHGIPSRVTAARIFGNKDSLCVPAKYREQFKKMLHDGVIKDCFSFPGSTNH